MKYLILSALVLHGATAMGSAELPAKAFSQYKIQVSFKDLDGKWLSGLQPGIENQMADQDGTIKLPSMMTRGGFPAELRIIQEYSVRLGTPVIPCGIMIDLNPAFNGETIQLSGTSTLRYPTDKSGNNTASRFITQENIVDLTLKEGETQSVNLDGGGRMLVTITFHNAKGERVSN